MALLTLPAV
jgi:hypothetical protein